MSKAPPNKRKRTAPKAVVSKSKRAKLAAAYHSSSEDESEPTSKQSRDTVSVSGQATKGKPTRKHPETKPTEKQHESGSEDDVSPALDESSADEDEEEEDSASAPSDIESETTSTTSNARSKLKRNDPTAFANSISKILDSKLTKGQRADPVLARSTSASKTAKELNELKLETTAKKKIVEDKKAKQERGRVKDVAGLDNPDISSGDIAEQEKQLKKMAQRGVIKLFNAVRAAQVKGEEAALEARMSGTIGVDQRQMKVNELSKQGFLDMLNAKS